MSTAPSATRPNLTAEPSSERTAPGRSAMKASVAGSPCERLTATVQGFPRRRARAGCGSARRAARRRRSSVSRSAPRPTMPRQIKPSAGAPTMPSSGAAAGHQREIDGEFVAAGDEFLGAVERVDQEEAVLVRRLRQTATRSSDSDGMFGASRASPSPMMRSAARSASVTGDPSVLPSTFMAARLTARMARAGPDHEIGQRLDQRGGGVAIDQRTELPHS